MQQNHQIILMYITLVIFGIIIVFSLFKLSQVITIIKQIADDTLKRKENGILRWSRTSLTMFVAMIVSVYLTIADFINEGFNFEVFLCWLTVALGSKVTDAISRKLDPSKNQNAN